MSEAYLVEWWVCRLCGQRYVAGPGKDLSRRVASHNARAHGRLLVECCHGRWLVHANHG